MKKDFQFGVNTLIGCRWNVLKDIERHFPVDKKFSRRYWWSKRIAWILNQAAKLDDLVFNRKVSDLSIDHPPVFIIGHWRSGTTLVHHYLTRVFPAAYPTTYQSVFTNNLFGFQGFIKWVMQLFLPGKRPTDHIRMHSNNPQEEEMALGNSIFFSFYYWLFFPGNAREIENRFLFPNKSNENEYQSFKSYYKTFVKRCLLNTKGKVFISKNPSNTPRIKVLLELFPNARFVYIHRNPYEVIESTKLFFHSVISGMQLQDVENQDFESFVVDLYQKLIQRYDAEKDLIPVDQLQEIKYENLVASPQSVLADVVEMLNLDIEPDLEKAFRLIEETDSYKRREYRFSKKYIREVNLKISDLIRRQGYATLS